MLIAAIAVLSLPTAALGQAPDSPRIEIGASVGAVDFRESLLEKPLTVGLRGGYRLRPWLGVEAEWLVAPQDATGYYGEQLLLAGPKAGLRAGPVTVLAKARAGLLHIGGRVHRAYRNGRARREAVFELGAIIELETSEHVAIRIDWGRAFIDFGGEPLRSPLPPYSRPLGTTVNGAGGIGLQVRF